MKPPLLFYIHEKKEIQLKNFKYKLIINKNTGVMKPKKKFYYKL